MESFRSISFAYKASDELSALFEEFRLMVNDAIRFATREKPKGRYELIKVAYHRLKMYHLHTHYILSACEVAYSLYKNPRRKKDPYIKRPFIKLDSQSYELNHLILRIPTRPRHFVYLTLSASNYQLSFLDDPSLKRGSITLTPSTLDVAFSRASSKVDPLGRIGIDVNERNVTWADSSGRVQSEDTSVVAELREMYREIRAKVMRRTSKDKRIQRRLLSKYGRRERNRATQAIHRVTRRIVEHAKAHRYEIVMEKLKWIRRLYRRGNGQGRSFRGRMNSWAFREIQRQVDYKARWEGIPVHYVNPRGTSRKCPQCDSSLAALEGRRLLCPSCKLSDDRDVVAAKNIMMACVVPQVRPGA